jgi:hypothetical protein
MRLQETTWKFPVKYPESLKLPATHVVRILSTVIFRANKARAKEKGAESLRPEKSVCNEPRKRPAQAWMAQAWMMLFLTA